ncbi:hypothetical protein [Paenibacillus sp. JDR-2]|uniref:hypothetical protein n=1 Tax=Paenibacillus sp. (strain JDR-2) TaxID=324057 RepID=UPI000166AB9F|nr:hypothetical protein [Paenibacillus sp. JDR-2]ACT04770.1 conserved hypothetical protein [Paenibacillus sp. JDR-2]
MNKELLREGLSVIAQCKPKTGDIWEAHFGAAAIAGYFLIQGNGIKGEMAGRIIDQSFAMLAAHPYSSGQPDILIPEMEYAAAANMILAALEPTIGELHWVGHHVIYSAASLLALRELGSWGAREDIEGICLLIRSFERTIPGRSWLGYKTSEVKRLTEEAEDRFPIIENAEQLSQFILDELASFEVIYKAESHHDLIGHMLTFSHALNVLDDLGYTEYFRRGLPAVLKLVKALRYSRHLSMEDSVPLYSPVDRLPLIEAGRSEYLPLEPEYWERDYAKLDWDFGHVFKFSHSFYDHIRRVQDPKPEAFENFRSVVCS